MINIRIVTPKDKTAVGPEHGLQSAGISVFSDLWSGGLGKLPLLLGFTLLLGLNKP